MLNAYLGWNHAQKQGNREEQRFCEVLLFFLFNWRVSHIVWGSHRWIFCLFRRCEWCPACANSFSLSSNNQASFLELQITRCRLFRENRNKFLHNSVLVQDYEPLNQNSHLLWLVDAICCAGIYPNIAKIGCVVFLKLSHLFFVIGLLSFRYRGQNKKFLLSTRDGIAG